MTNIDEAIAHAREISAEKRKQADNYRTYSLQDGDVWNDNIEGCEDCAKDHEQLAEWLEELKSYRMHVFCGDMTQQIIKEERSKAINEFVQIFKSRTTMENKLVDEIAEELKAESE